MEYTQKQIEAKERLQQMQEKINKIKALKYELDKTMEDIAQEQLGIVRDDYDEKRKRAAEIINELRVLSGKEPREVKL